MSKHRETLYLPDPIAEAALAGNLDYPQTSTGIAVYGCRAAMDMIVSGEVTWQQVMYSRPTEPQLQSVKKAVAKAHRAFDVTYRHQSDPDAGDHTFTTERLAGLTMSFLAPFARTVTGFAAGMLPGVEPVPDDVPLYMRKHNTTDVAAMRELQITALDRMFGHEATAVVRPEVIALQGMWAASHDAINPRLNPAAREMSKERLPLIRLSHIAGKHSITHKNAVAALKEQNLAISYAATDAVYTALPRVQDDTNLWIPGVLVDDFLRWQFGAPAHRPTVTIDALA